MDNRLNVSVWYLKKLGGYFLYPVSIEDIVQINDAKLGLNFTLLAPIHEWRPSYYFTTDPPLVWKYSGPLVEIDNQSTLCFLLLMFLSATMVYFSTRCLRRWFPSTTGFWTILWDFAASFFFEPFPNDSGILSIRLVFSFWLLGITIFCNEVNAVFKGKLSVKEYAGVETRDDLNELEYTLRAQGTFGKYYYSNKYGKRTRMVLKRYVFDAYLQNNLYVSKKSAADEIYTHLVYLGNIQSRLFMYNPRIHEIIMNWELRLYEGSTGYIDEQKESAFRLKNPFIADDQLFTAYVVGDLSVPFRLYGYGLLAAIAVKFIEATLAIYNIAKQKRKHKKCPLSSDVRMIKE